MLQALTQESWLQSVAFACPAVLLRPLSECSRAVTTVQAEHWSVTRRMVVPGPIVELEDGTQLQAKVVVGADGAVSQVRAHVAARRACTAPDAECTAPERG